MKIITIIHIVFGIVALFSGFISLIQKKGSTTHKLSGRIFFISMLVVCFAALVLHLPKGLYFLPAIGVFSFYLVYTGVGIYRIKKSGYNLMDKLMTLFCGIAGLGLIGISVLQLINGNKSMLIIQIVFGIACITLSYNDAKLIYKKIKPLVPVKAHLQRMSGAYIATITAVLVVNAGRIDWVQNHSFIWPILWFLPSVVGSLLIVRTLSKNKL